MFSKSPRAWGRPSRIVMLCCLVIITLCWSVLQKGAFASEPSTNVASDFISATDGVEAADYLGESEASAVCVPTNCGTNSIYPVREGGQQGEPIRATDGEEICIEIRLNRNSVAIDAYGYTVRYNPNRLTLRAIERGNLTREFLAADCNLSQPGVLLCSGFNESPIFVNSSGVLARLCFTVSYPPSAKPDSSDITITDLLDDLRNIRACCNLLIASNPIQGSCAGAAVYATTPGGAAGDPIVGKQGETVKVEVRVKETNRAASAFRFNFNYDAGALTFDKAEPGELTTNFSNTQVSAIRPGVLALTASNGVPLPASSNGVLFNLYFTANCVAGDTSSMKIDSLAQDFAAFSGCENEFICKGCEPADCSGPALYLTPPNGKLGDVLSEAHGGILDFEVRVQQNPNAIGAFGFRVKYDPNKLSFVDARAGNLTAGFVAVDARELEPGLVMCAGFGTNAVPAQSQGALIALSFTVNCVVGDSGEIKIVELQDDVAGLGTCCNFFVCAPCEHDGDVNTDELLTASDALCAFETYLNGGILPATCDLPKLECELLAADANCDNTITARDALAIFSRSLSALPPADCFGRSGGKILTGLPLLRLSAPAYHSGDDTLALVVEIGNAASLDAFGLLLQFPAHAMRFVGVRRLSSTSSWTALNGREYLPGMALLGGFDPEPLQATASVAVLEVILVANGSDIDNNTFSVSNLVDDLERANVIMALDDSETSPAPQQFKLYQNYPNPLQVSAAPTGTVIRYDLPTSFGSTMNGASAPQVELIIYNLQGQVIRRLFSGSQTPGVYNLTWDGRNDAGVRVPSGTYQYRLKAGEFVEARRLLVVK